MRKETQFTLLTQDSAQALAVVLWPNVVLALAAIALFGGRWVAARWFGTIALSGAALEVLLTLAVREDGAAPAFGVGFYAWLSSFALVAVPAWIKRR